MIKILLILLAGLLGLNFSGMTQDEIKSDSLLQMLRTAKEDSAKVKLLLQTGEQFIYNDYKRAEKYYQDAFELSKKIAYRDGIWHYYTQYLGLLSNRGWSDSVATLGLEMLEWCKKINDSTKIGTALYLIGYSYMTLSDNENAARYFEESRVILERHLGNERIDGYSYYYLGLIANGMHQYRKSVDYSLKAIEKFTLSAAPDLVCYATLSLGYNYIQLKAYDSARYYLKRCLSLAKQINLIETQILCNLNFGYIYMLQRDFDRMKPYADTGLILSRKYGFIDDEGRSLWGLSVYYLSKKQYDLAKLYADSSFSIANKTHNGEQRLRLLQHLSNLAFAMQDPQLGYYYSGEGESSRDSLLNDNIQKIITDNETKFETGKKEAQIKIQQAVIRQKNILNYVFAISAIIFFIALVLGWRNYKHRRKLQQQRILELETEKQLAATEALLKGEEQERTRMAKDLHDGLGGMLSGIKYSLNTMKDNLIMAPDNMRAFERSIDMLDSSIREMRRVAHNMMPEMLLKYGLNTALKEICNEIDRSGVIHVTYQAIGMDEAEIDQTTAVTIYRIVQELVNNAIKHATAKNVLVQAHTSLQERLLTITVEDDGKGFDTGLLQQSSGMGWANIQNRVEFLKGKIDINSGLGTGTSVLIEINL